MVATRRGDISCMIKGVQHSNEIKNSPSPCPKDA